MRAWPAIVLVLIAASVASNSAMYVFPDMDQVPRRRVLANLVREVRRHPADGHRHWALARIHGECVYRLESLTSVKQGTLDPAFGPRSDGFAGVPDDATPAERRRHLWHLRQSVIHHRRAAELLADNVLVTLGLAYALDMYGSDAEAVTLYRRVLREIWVQDDASLVDLERRVALARRKSAANAPTPGDRWQVVSETPPGRDQPFLTEEVVRYLRPHLREPEDRQEIRRLDAWVARAESLPQFITPLLVPLDNAAGVDDIVDRGAAVRFDADGLGRGGAWSWITPRAAWLVWDPARTGRVRSGTQLFGNVTFWLFWPDGYRALASLDDDGDGSISGPELDGLALWQDRDADGVSDAGEVRPVQRWGVTSLAARGVGHTHRDVSAWAADGVRFRDGTIRPTYDLLLRSAPPALTRR